MKNHKGDEVPSSLVSIFSQHSNCCLAVLSWPYSTTTILNLKPSAIRAWKDHRFGSFHKQSFIEKAFRIRRTYYYLLCFQISLVLGQTRKMYSKLIINEQTYFSLCCLIFQLMVVCRSTKKSMQNVSHECRVLNSLLSQNRDEFYTALTDSSDSVCNHTSD